MQRATPDLVYLAGCETRYATPINRMIAAERHMLAGVTLVDPGLPDPESYDTLVRRLASVSIPIERVHTVFITHSHPDHYGAAQRIRSLSGAEIVTHENFKTYWDPHEEDDFIREVAVVTDYEVQAGAIEGALMKLTGRERHSPWDRPVPWGGPPPDNAWKERLRWRILPLLLDKVWQPPKPSKRVVDGAVLMLGDREWVSVHTPGHTADHLCLLDPTEGIFVSGDHLLPTITPHIGGFIGGDPLANYLTNLDKVADLEGITRVLPAHGHPFDDLPARCNAIKDHHASRLQMLADAGD